MIFAFLLYSPAFATENPRPDHVPDADVQRISIREAATQGLPTTHSADPICNCVHLDWASGGTLSRLDLAAGDVLRIVQTSRSTSTVGDELSLETRDGNILIERGPCLIVSAAAQQIGRTLQRPPVQVNEVGQPAVCMSLLTKLAITPPRVATTSPAMPIVPRLVATDDHGEAWPSANIDVVRALGPRIGHCRQIELENDPTMGSQLSVRGRVNRHGELSRARASGDGLDNERAEACILAVLATLQFESGATGNVTLTWDFPSVTQAP